MQERKAFSRGVASALMVGIFIVGLLSGGIITYLIFSQRISDLENEVSSMQVWIDALKKAQNSSFVVGNVSLSEIYERVKDSVVMIYADGSQGSGFVYDFLGRMVIVTNYHVIINAVNVIVRFRNGNAYKATVLGSDAYADLAVLSIQGPENEFKPIPIASSSSLKVGDFVIAIGNPFGLTGSMTTGVVSQLGRTIRLPFTGGYSIGNVIQISAPINPGNSGGPLLNAAGYVVGITTAIETNSQGVGFAIPSNTILREIYWLVNQGYYDKHSWLGVTGTDMSFEIAQAMHVNITYGWLIIETIKNGPAEKAGLKGGTQTVSIGGTTITVGGDIIIAMNNVPIVNGDDLSTYMEEYTLPGQIVEVTVFRENATLTIPVELGTRPPLSS
ncbi:MAG: trypsin-like peptidase domain-containing protein [Candidatus Bathyarchaeia archaeon]